MDIYVGNLAYATTDEGLKAAFAAYGEVTSARVVTDRTSGRSKGFGFVEMPNREQAQAAIDALNGQPLDGRPVRVNESQPKPPRTDRGDRRGGDPLMLRQRGTSVPLPAQTTHQTGFRSFYQTENQ